MKLSGTKTSLLYMLFIALLGCDNSRPTSEAILSEPTIECGKIKVTGQIISESLKGEQIKGQLNVAAPITGKFQEYPIHTDYEGGFVIEIESETNPALCALWSDAGDGSAVFFLKNGNEAKLEIAYDEAGNIQNVDVSGGVEVSDSDMLNYDNAAYSLHEFRPENHPVEKSLYDKDFDYYLDQIDRTLQRRMDVACIDTLLSDDVKDIVTKDFSLLFYSFNVFEYESAMRSNYMDINDGKIPDSLEIQTPTMELYSSLKKLNLNDPQYLYSLTFLPEYFMPAILYNDILNIPRIADTPIDVWLGQVRTIMSDVVGFDEGLFYDLLVSNSYGRQLTIETTPLTQKQIENIKAYYRGGEIEKILFRKNDAVVKLASGMGNVVINETPAVPAEEVLDAIISKYKGKIVLVDLWATWCGPCIAAMDKIRPLKSELKDRVVFVYITNASSERKLWDEMTRGIDGEHYFLEDESAWEYIMETNELEYIPSYLLYDKEGTLQNKIEAFPGAEVLREKIEALAE